MKNYIFTIALLTLFSCSKESQVGDVAPLDDGLIAGETASVQITIASDYHGNNIDPFVEEMKAGGNLLYSSFLWRDDKFQDVTHKLTPGKTQRG